jgi:hypothetical protein
MQDRDYQKKRQKVEIVSRPNWMILRFQVISDWNLINYKWNQLPYTNI